MHPYLLVIVHNTFHIELYVFQIQLDRFFDLLLFLLGSSVLFQIVLFVRNSLQNITKNPYRTNYILLVLPYLQILHILMAKSFIHCEPALPNLLDNHLSSRNDTINLAKTRSGFRIVN